MRKMIHRALRGLGLHLEKHRDIGHDLAEVVGPDVRCAVDGGCYKGTVSREFLRMFPRAQVHAFEPQAELFAPLAEASKAEPRWHVHNLALSDEAGEHEFHTPEKAAYTGSLLAPTEALGRAPAVSSTVRTTTLDAWAAEHGVSPEVLKLDLQGAELAAIRGAASILPGVKAVVCEVNFVPRYEGCCVFGEVVSAMLDAGLHLGRIYEIHAGRSGLWTFGDALFVRRP